jgi:hypothetical protein
MKKSYRLASRASPPDDFDNFVRGLKDIALFYYGVDIEGVRVKIKKRKTVTYIRLDAECICQIEGYIPQLQSDLKSPWIRETRVEIKKEYCYEG